MFFHVGFFFALDGTGKWQTAGGMPMNDSASIMAQCPGESSLTIPVPVSDLGYGEEHVALLVDLRRFGLLRRWDDLLDEGVAAVFGLASGEAELQALSFHAGKFTPVKAETWLAKRGLKPRLFVPNSGRLAATSMFHWPLRLGGLKTERVSHRLAKESLSIVKKGKRR
jgi:hypothetical protein